MQIGQTTQDEQLSLNLELPCDECDKYEPLHAITVDGKPMHLCTPCLEWYPFGHAH